MFIKNTNIPPAQYTLSRQKELARLLKISIFKVVTSADIPSIA